MEFIFIADNLETNNFNEQIIQFTPLLIFCTFCDILSFKGADKEVNYGQ